MPDQVALGSAHGGPSSCPPGQFLTYNSMINVRSCVSAYPGGSSHCITCQYNQQLYAPNASMNYFPSGLYQPNPAPWWAYQGQMSYPNMNYPGAWNSMGPTPGMMPQHYPGSGQVFAAKPNIYVSGNQVNRAFHFDLKDGKGNFLATTPAFSTDYQWQGELTGTNQFQVDGILYDYLFYDVRLSLNHLQFTHGLCGERKDLIDYMLSDLKNLGHPQRSLDDFSEHWQVKIPAYPYYCVYPQYDTQLEANFPIEKGLMNSRPWRRSLYVMVPHREVITTQLKSPVPLPYKDPASITPEAADSRSGPVFLEWGVAFLESAP